MIRRAEAALDRSRAGVVRDEVHHNIPRTGSRELPQLQGALVAVVDACQEHVLHHGGDGGGRVAAASRCVLVERVQQILQRRLLRGRHDFLPELLRRRVQREREVHRRRIHGQLQHPGHHTHGGDRDARGGEVELAEASVVRHRAQGGDDGRIVVERLAHAHEHSVPDGRPPRSDLHGVGVEQLLDDLRGIEVADDGHRARGTEGATHLATDL
mmetsp:Transcript_77140/g.223911  ORF Transcript_77140/g.223911 Transcript_77140/m.223911 type:complete len:213 (+) Transcript_77140:375-1013(+)